jgi:hypothetical protein
VKADALVEAALGLALVLGAAMGALGPGDFPHPVGTTVIVAVGLALLGLAALLWRAATRAVPASLLLALACGNLATALAAAVWLLAADGFSSAGSAVILTTAVGLACLAAVQLAVRARLISRVATPT